MDGGAWWAAVHGVAKSQTRLRDFSFSFHFHALEKEMATCSSVLAWRIPGMGEPGGPPSMGSHRVGHDWSDLAAAASRVTIYSLDILLSQFWTSPLFHVQFYCCFLTCIQVSQQAGKVVWYSYLFKNFPDIIVIHTVKGFSIINEPK